MRKQLEQMGKELRELMIYQSPPELGALFTDVELMTKELGAQQKVLVAKQMQIDAAKAKRRAMLKQHYQLEFAIGIGCLAVMFVMGGFFMWVAHDAQKRWGSALTDRPYQKQLEAVRRQEWFEHQKKLDDYQEFLRQKHNATDN
jgi:hypothetical protein